MNDIKEVIAYLISVAPSMAPVFIMGVVNMMALIAAMSAFAMMTRAEGLPKWVYPPVLFALGVDLIAMSMLDIGKSFELLTEGWLSVTMICTFLLGGVGLSKIPEIIRARNGKGEVETR